jgi:hypothetical protein
MLSSNLWDENLYILKNNTEKQSVAVKDVGLEVAAE